MIGVPLLHHLAQIEGTPHLPRHLVFPQPGIVAAESFEPSPLGPEHVEVRIEQSLISTGTEMTALGGRFDPDSHWGAYVQYPFYPGYSSSGTIVDVGPNTTGANVGDRVFTMWPHASTQVLPVVSAFPIPDDVPFASANWCALAGVAYVGIRRAAIVPGESVAIIGAGPVGQMVTRWAAICGAGRVIVIDTAANRLAIATDGGATHTISASIAEAHNPVLEANNGKRPPVIIDTTGRSATLAEALPLVADFGRLVLVGDAGNPTEQHLTSDIISRGVQIIGTHGNYMPYVIGQRNLADREGLALEQVLAERVLGWRAFSRMFFDLIRQQRFPLAGMTSHTMPIDEAATAYALLAERRTETMGISFSWN